MGMTGLAQAGYAHALLKSVSRIVYVCAKPMAINHTNINIRKKKL